ncbi:hypothetical protein IAU60_001521 [Kwoniella sp. DSM 27419]
MSNAVASSSKRPHAATTDVSAGPSVNKKPRQASSASPVRGAESVHGDAEDDDQDDGDKQSGQVYESLEEEAKAKAARKEARTIRNRESAQRSRNQRKAHLVYLEARVNELEAENRALRSDGSSHAMPSTPMALAASPSGSAREASPAQSVISLANDLGIPSELIGSTGVKLSNVAPPPADLHLEDVKPVIPQSPGAERTRESGSVTGDDSLQAENAALRARISLLENLVKQVVAVANLSGFHETKPVVPEPVVVAEPSHPIDWAAFLSVPHVDTSAQPGLEATLSPTLYPTSLADTPSMASAHPAPTSVSNLPPSIHEVTSNPVARHPAEVATITPVSSSLTRRGMALQRARGITSMSSSTVAEALATDKARLALSEHAAMFEGISAGQGEMDWENGQVQAQVESWDEAMRSLIEDVEGRSGPQVVQPAGDVLGMEWFSHTGRIVV